MKLTRSRTLQTIVLATMVIGLIALALGKVVLLVSVALCASRFLLPPIFSKAARVPE